MFIFSFLVLGFGSCAATGKNSCTEGYEHQFQQEDLQATPCLGKYTAAPAMVAGGGQHQKEEAVTVQ